MKKKIFNTVVILLIIALSLVGGLIYAGVSRKNQAKAYPIRYREQIEAEAAARGIPVNTVYAVLKTCSDWNVSYEKDGKVGLYAMTEDKFVSVAARLNESRDTRLRWSPEVSIVFCVADLSDCLGSFTDKNAAFAALYGGKEKVSANVAAHGGKFSLSDTDEYTQNFVRKVTEALNIYNELHPEGAAAPVPSGAANE